MTLPALLRRSMAGLAFLAGLVVLLLFVLAAMSRPPEDLGLHAGRLAPCPASPNCVSSQAEDDRHRVAALPYKGYEAQAWAAVVDAVLSLPRTTIVTELEHYLHAEVRSFVFRFVDDLEVHLDEEAGLIHFRSASRAGYSDLGVNRRRVERLTAMLRERLPG